MSCVMCHVSCVMCHDSLLLSPLGLLPLYLLSLLFSLSLTHTHSYVYPLLLSLSLFLSLFLSLVLSLFLSLYFLFHFFSSHHQPLVLGEVIVRTFLTIFRRISSIPSHSCPHLFFSFTFLALRTPGNASVQKSDIHCPSG